MRDCTSSDSQYFARIGSMVWWKYVMGDRGTHGVDQTLDVENVDECD